ncbi:MAG: PQQ-binding-like beta-propeller repeat protein [Acidobacteria bacterium]|nr:PQQ-binding-like beta-propeller repeat protein [Acidobacteriota bacterium]
MTRRTTPPRWLWAFWTVALVLIVLMRRVLDMPDVGLMNIATYALVILSTIVGLGWFLVRSAHPVRTRLITLGSILVVMLLANFTLELRGWSGAMVPIVGLRGGGAPAIDMAGGGTGGVDLLTTTPYDFAGYLGSDRSLTIANVQLARDWSAAEPEMLWKQPIGSGWGGFAVVNGHAATLEQRAGVEIVTLYDVETGDLKWATEIGEAFAHPLGGQGPRSTPLIHEGTVYAMGVRGHLVALDGANGALVWERDVLRDYGISLAEEDANVAYGRPTSPLVVGDSLVVGVGGSAERRVSVVAYQRGHGEVAWEGGNRNVSMASPGYGVLAGVPQILMVNENFVTGHDAATGAVLWEFDWPGITAADSNVSQAVPVAPDKVFVSKGYGSGAALYRLVANGDGTFTPQQEWHSARVLRTKLTNVAIHDGYVYGLSEGVLECVDLATGERVWKAGRYGHGQILMVGDLLLVLSEDGELFLVEGTPQSRNNVLGQIQAIDGHTWNTFALYGDVVVVRNAQEAAAYRLPLEMPLARPAQAEPLLQ